MFISKNYLSKCHGKSFSYRGSALCQSQKPYFRRSAAEHKAVGLVVGGFNDGVVRNSGRKSFGICRSSFWIF